jgi:hypothetical protein
VPEPAYQPAQAPKGQEYGQAGQQLASQGIQPMAASPLASPGRPRVSPGQQGDSGGVLPGDIPGLTDPTANPDEPITAGLASGPGPGPSALNTAAFGPEELSILRGILLKYPNDDLRRQLEWTESNLA